MGPNISIESSFMDLENDAKAHDQAKKRDDIDDILLGQPQPIKSLDAQASDRLNKVSQFMSYYYRKVQPRLLILLLL